MSNEAKKERSRAYPVMALDEALNRVSNLSRNLGLNGQFSRESVAVGIGYSSLNGASARAVAALSQYGLLDRDKDQYSLSRLAKQYLLPSDDKDKDSAIAAAALTPALFGEVYGAFKGQIIPRQFTNRLVTEFGIQQKASVEVEKIFRATMETAGLLLPNGMLAQAAAQADTTQPNDENVSESVNKGTINHSGASGNFLTVGLPSGLIIGYPQTLASAFAFGEFGSVLKALNDAVANYNKNSGSSAQEGGQDGEK